MEIFSLVIGQIKFESRSLALLALDVDVSLVILNCCPDDGHAQTGPTDMH